MGNQASNPLVAMAAQNQMNAALGDATAGVEDAKAAAKKSEEQKKNEERAINRINEFEEKKKAREERKKKLAEQWGAHRKTGTR